MGRRFRAIGALTLGGQCWVIHTCLLPQITCLPAAVSYAKPHVLGDRVEALKEPSLIETQSNIRCPDPICRAGSLMFQMGPTDQHAVGVNIEIILLALAVLPRRILECDFDVRAHADSIPPPGSLRCLCLFCHTSRPPAGVPFQADQGSLRGLDRMRSPVPGFYSGPAGGGDAGTASSFNQCTSALPGSVISSIEPYQ